MRSSYQKCVLALPAVLLAAMLSMTSGLAQTAGRFTVKGRVTDPSAASVPNAIVILRGEGKTLRQETDEQGDYSFANVAAGKYSLRIGAKGFAVFENKELMVAGNTTVDAAMVVSLDTQQITVEDETKGVSVDQSANVGSLVLKGQDLEALSDDPDQLAQDLQALAGPAAGPNGGQIFVDGFSGGRLPPKSSIREVRVNSNPFSAEYDRLGFGRIEILTKPGSDRFRGQIMTMFSDNFLNARNPFTDTKPDFRSLFLVGTVGGKINKKSSFNFDIERRGVDEFALINATTLTPSLTRDRLQITSPTPQARWNISPRYDLALNDKNTLVARYQYSRLTDENNGIGQFSLPELAYNTYDTDHTLQLTETAILNATTINETRFQFMRGSNRQDGDISRPGIRVLEAFSSGSNQVGLASNLSKRFEIQNLTTHTRGAHTVKFGGRVRVASISDLSPQNFGGTFTFAGGLAPQLDANNQVLLGSDGFPLMMQIDSLERYRRTEFFRTLGYTGAQIRALGGGASQFSISGGNPLASVDQTDLGMFVLDDWRLKPNVSVGLGLRFEKQTNISDWSNISPRISLAWGIGGSAGKQAKTVLRTGFGIFYDRVSENLVMQTLRFNGLNQQQFLVANPDFYPNVPTVDSLAANRLSETIRTFDAGLRAPQIMQFAFGLERQLPKNTTVGANYTFSRGVHALRARNINAPLASGVRPYGDDLGNLYMYESTGLYRQNQLMANFNTRFSRRVSLFGFYTLGYARGDADGSGSFPASSYNLSSEYGPTMFDTRHRMMVISSVNGPRGISINPFVTANSGGPFNITTGRDNNGDSVFNDRPSFAVAGTPGAVVTPWGVFNPNPLAGEELIPRNYGRAPSQFSVNMRLSKTWGFGKRGASGPDQNWVPPGGGGGGRGPGGPGGGGPGGGGPPMMMGGGGGGRGGPGGGGPGGMFGSNSEKRFNVTLSVNARNLFNTVNLGAPVGNLSSPLFGQSTALAGGFGPMGASSGYNRRLDFQLRFAF